MAGSGSGDRVLVTGGAGFIGSHVVEALLERGVEVEVIDNLSTGKRENVPPGVRLHLADVAGDDAARAVERFRPGAVVHLAAQASVAVSTADPPLDCRTNVLGTVRMLDAARRSGGRRFVLVSSAAVYGPPEHVPTLESHPVRPMSFYGLSKAVAEWYASRFAEEGMDCAILRYANVYGPRQDAHGEAGVVAVFIDTLLRGGRPVIHGDGTQTRDFVYVEDVAAATAEVALRGQAGARVLNVGTGAETSVNELFDMVRRVCGSDAAPLHDAPRPGDIPRSALDASAARTALGWRARWSLEDGLVKTVEWYSANGSRAARRG